MTTIKHSINLAKTVAIAAPLTPKGKNLLYRILKYNQTPD